MYLPKYHQCTDHETAQSLIDAHPLGAWVCHGGGELTANHVPFVLDRTRGVKGSLIGHVSRANGVWRSLTSNTPSVVMFQGPQSYITPGWYPGKTEHGKVVPTWNYVVAHVHGVARAVEDKAWLLDMLDRLTQSQESGRVRPWKVSDAPADYIGSLLRAIVGIEIPIDRLEGKLKLSQDEDLADRIGTINGLREHPREEGHALAALIQHQLHPPNP